MAVRPSCPVLLIHDDDGFRKALIASLDRKHFSVTFTADEDEAIRQLAQPGHPFRVILLSVDLASGHGMKTLAFLREQGDGNAAHVILLGEPDPDLRRHADVADETLLKPVGADYVADRASAYCG